MTDNVNHPAHYHADGPHEVIKVLEAWGLFGNHCLANSVKYIARAGKKDPTKYVEDLQKARWYLDYEIKRAEEMQRLSSPPTTKPIHNVSKRTR